MRLIRLAPVYVEARLFDRLFRPGKVRAALERAFTENDVAAAALVRTALSYLRAGGWLYLEDYEEMLPCERSAFEAAGTALAAETAAATGLAAQGLFAAAGVYAAADDGKAREEIALSAALSRAVDAARNGGVTK